MREILFRGRDKYTNEWFYGFVEAPHTTVDGVVESYYFNSYVNGKSCRKIISANTLGQYTGLTDKNGTKIFEGDIVITKTTSYKFVGCILYSTEDEENNVFQCSNCKEEFVLISGSPKENGYEYCPHCGYKMDEVATSER